MLDAEILDGLVAVASRDPARIPAYVVRRLRRDKTRREARLSRNGRIQVRSLRDQYLAPAVPALDYVIGLKPESAVLIDPELGRVATGLKQLADFRIWAYARALSFDSNAGAGWIWKQELFESLKALGIVHTRRAFNDRNRANEQYHNTRIFRRFL